MYSVYAMLGLMFLTWGVAIWATFMDSDHHSVSSSSHGRRTELKKAA